jgi:hypothetical protein
MQRSLLICPIVVVFTAISFAARADVYKAGDSFLRFAAPGKELRELLINKTATSG